MGKLFSDREVRAVVWFLPLAGIFIAGMVLLRPKADSQTALRAEAEMEKRADSVVLRPFDPNKVDFDELRALGLTKYEAASLLRYRAAGKIFRIPEDVALCYGISDSLYRVLTPYIRIPRKYRRLPGNFRSERIVEESTPVSAFCMDTVSASYLVAIGAFSKRQAKVVIDWRNRGGFRDMDEFRACYVVDDSVATALEPYIVFAEPLRDLILQSLELNTADSAALRGVVGIGEKTVTAIMQYRERLGGFRSVEQLAEIPGMNERNYERILKQIYCDSCEIRKIDVNFASPNELSRHPYVQPKTLRKLLKTRQLKGGWSTAEELLKDHILTKEEAARLVPYLRFSVSGGLDDE